jgi:hypothetical protein
MKRKATEIILSTQEKTNEHSLPDRDGAGYEVHLCLSGLPTGGTDFLRAAIEAALSASVPDGLVTVLGVDESVPRRGDGWVEEQITPLGILFRALPAEFQRADILAALAEYYHRELAFLWRSVRDRRCVQGVIELRPWRQAGTQWICEFLSCDRSVPIGDKYNLYGKNTSQWSNPMTGWSGHQGAIVLDTGDGQVSSHH